ncbi:MAG: four helix bundle protein [Chloroflexota bacterium]|nr:MAG: four helix bundle protein [Chloroflexota bacterium]
MSVKNYRDLRVWQSAMDLVVLVYEISEKFPSKEMYGLTSQIRRAGVSVPSNIAEGHTRESTKEYLHHLSIAQASLAEVETQIEIAFRLKYCAQEELDKILSHSTSLGKQLYSLRNALQSRNSQ